MTPGWSERQLRALAQIFETISEPAYDDESRRHAELAASALNEVAEPADLRLLKLLLGVFETAAGSVALGHGPRPFSKLTRARREQILEGWANSRVARRRTFFQTVKRLASFFAYADPGPAGTNPRWKEIGYAAARNDPAEPTDAIAQALVVHDADGDVVLDADVVIVGSGAGGGLIAARLAAAGRDVLVVEAGPYVPEPELPADELAAFDRLYLDHGMTATADVGVSILSGAALGGGTLVNWTTSIEPPTDIRARWAADFGLAGFDGAETDKTLCACAPSSASPRHRRSGQRTRPSLTAVDRSAGRLHPQSAMRSTAATAARAALAVGAVQSCPGSGAIWRMLRPKALGF